MAIVAGAVVIAPRPAPVEIVIDRDPNLVSAAVVATGATESGAAHVTATVTVIGVGHVIEAPVICVGGILEAALVEMSGGHVVICVGLKMTAGVQKATSEAPVLI